MAHDAQLVLIAGALLAVAVTASLAAARVRIPTLVLLIGIGMAIGSDGLGWIAFDDDRLARLVGSIALAAILFEGGLQTGLRTLRPVLGPAVLLATVGTALTALVAGLIGHWLLHLSVAEGLLLGAILSPTDGAAVFALLRGIHLPRRLALILEGEAGLNDPVAVALVVAMIEIIRHPGDPVGSGLLVLVRELGIGLAAGVVVGVLAAQAQRRLVRQDAATALVASFAAGSRWSWRPCR